MPNASPRAVDADPLLDSSQRPVALHCFMAPVGSLSLPQLRALWRWVPTAKQRAWKRLRCKHARIRSICGYALLQAALKALLPTPMLPELILDENGRPRLKNGLHISLSHSAQWVGCVLAEVAVGLDLERRRPLSQRTRRRWQQQGWDFFQSWCAREAVIKAADQGSGFSALRDMELSAKQAVFRQRTWRLHRVEPAAGYAGQIATQAVHAQPICVHTTFERLNALGVASVGSGAYQFL